MSRHSQLQARKYVGKAAQPFLNEATKQAIQKMQGAGATFTPIVQDPSGIICLMAFDLAKRASGIISLVAYPDGGMQIEARGLPVSERHEFAIGMVKTARDRLLRMRTSGELLDVNGILTVAVKSGYVRFKTDLLPQGQELDYAINMLESTLGKLDDESISARLKIIGHAMKMESAVPTISAVEG